MKKSEFLRVVAYLTAATGKALTKDSVDVYFDLLGDLPLDAFQLAAKQVALEHKWATFPSVAELRSAATNVMVGSDMISSAEAWQLAWRAAGRIDLDMDGSLQRACEGLPSLVVEAMRCYGISSLCYGDDPIGVVRSQFIKIFDQLAERTRRSALLPASLKQAITEVSRKQLPAATVKLLENFGNMDE